MKNKTIEKIIKYFSFVIIFFLLFYFPTKTLAQTENVYIEDFQANVNVLDNGIVNITEEILYVFNESRHGMYRKIPIFYELENGQTQYLDITINNVSYKSVTNENLLKTYTTSTDNQYLNIKIGDPNILIQGKYLYTISYDIKYLIENYNNMDKLYLNVLGGEWDDPIYNAIATITMPSDILEYNCYTGVKNSTDNNCNIKKTQNNQITVNSDQIFRENNFFTIVATVAPGTIQDLSQEKAQYKPTLSNNTQTQVNNYFKYFSFGVMIFIILMIIIIFFMVFKKTKFGSFSKNKKVEYLPNTIPQYDIPPGWYILKTDLLLNGYISNSGITAQIIQLCIYGYFTMTKEEKNITLHKTEKSIDDLVEPLKYFYKGLIQEKALVTLPSAVSYKDYANEEYMTFQQMFYYNFKIAQMKIKEELNNNGYLPKKESKQGSYIPSLFFFIIFFLIFFSFFIGLITSIFLIPLISFGVGFIILIILAVVNSLEKRKQIKPNKYSEKGEEIVRHIHGLQMYIDTAEEERLEFHNDPNKYQGVFDSLLPYAILFGLEEKWVKLFHINNFNWFSNSSGSDFSIRDITTSVNSFAHSATVTVSSSGGYSSSSSSSGSSGGSSGGGGGGGGGGSW
jgi:uncharacterized membrane protein YgcG